MNGIAELAHIDDVQAAGRAGASQSLPAPDTSAHTIAHAVDVARRGERLRNARRFCAVRAAGVGLFFLLFLVLGRIIGFSEWRGGDVVLAAYAVVAVLLLAAVRLSPRVGEASGFAIPLLDVPAIGVLEWALLPGAPNPPELVSFNAATYLLLIAGSTVWLQPVVIVATAMAAIVGQSWLMLSVGQDPVNLTSPIVLFALAATVGVHVARRLTSLVGRATANLIAEKQAENELHAAQESFRDLIEHSPDGILVHRGERVLYVNPQATALLGYDSPSGVVGKSGAELIHPADLAEARERAARLEQGGGPTPPAEIRLLARQGNLVHAEMRGVAVVFDGRPAILSHIRDLTEQKRLQRQSLITERMASMGMLAAGVAHEINNPLAVVVGNLEVLREGLTAAGGQAADAARLDDMVRESIEATRRVRDIVRDLKVFSRADEERRSPLDPRQVMESTLRLASNEIRHRARLVKQYDDVPLVEANESRLGQVFLNLILNAAQAIPEGRADSHEIRVVTGTAADGRAVIEVHDTGAGMPADVVQRIFEPFFTTKPIGIGTGLGLAICHRVVSALGGAIVVESAPGLGTVFRVMLPPATAHDAVPDQPAAAAKAPASRRGRVLVVDDEVFVGKMVERILSRDHDVAVVTSAAEALARLRAGERFDVLLCDVMMPHMTGMELHEALAAAAPEVARSMIFLTGGAFTPGARDFLDRIPNLHIDKPFDARNLRALVAERIR